MKLEIHLKTCLIPGCLHCHVMPNLEDVGHKLLSPVL